MDEGTSSSNSYRIARDDVYTKNCYHTIMISYKSFTKFFLATFRLFDGPDAF